MTSNKNSRPKSAVTGRCPSVPLVQNAHSPMVSMNLKSRITYQLIIEPKGVTIFTKTYTAHTATGASSTTTRSQNTCSPKPRNLTETT